jgi:hypothetical protein
VSGRPQTRHRLEELEVGERLARERYGLYRAKVYGPRATSIGRLRELEHAWKLAQSRLQRARSSELGGPTSAKAGNPA